MRLRLLIPCIFAFTSLLTFAQVAPPGGGGTTGGGTTGTTTGGTTGSTTGGTTDGGAGSWQIEYLSNGHTQTHYEAPGIVPTDSDTPWDPNSPPQWSSTPKTINIAGLVKNPQGYGTVNVSGSISVRVTWVGTGAAPSKVWLMVISSANWSGSSGSCNDGQGDPTVALLDPQGQVAGGSSTGRHLIRKAYAGQPITFTISLSSNCARSGAGPYSAGAGLTVATTDKTAALARNDNGILTEVDGGYEAHTLLSWTGIHDGVDYDNLADGGPGKTTQTLTGTFGGSWTTATFVDPANNQNYTTFNVQVNWSGGSGGSSTFVPPTPQKFVNSTTYTGDMPLFEVDGTSAKTQDWKYTAKDLGPADQGGATQVDLICHWFAHYAHENWSETAGDPNRPEISTIYGSEIWQVNLSEEYPTATTTWTHQQTIHVSTLYDGGISIVLGFAIQKYHIGISEIRDAFDQSQNLTYGTEGQSTGITATWDGFSEGTYHVYVAAKAPLRRGTIDVWNKKGQKGLGSMRFAPSSSYTIGTEVVGPLGGN